MKTDRSGTEDVSGTYSSVGRRIGSDGGGLGLESQTGQVRGKPTPSLWRDKLPTIKGLRPPDHYAGQFHRDQKDSSESEQQQESATEDVSAAFDTEN